MVRALFPHAFRGRRLVNRDRFRAGGGQFERIGLPGLVVAPPDRRSCLCPYLLQEPGFEDTVVANAVAGLAYEFSTDTSSYDSTLSWVSGNDAEESAISRRSIFDHSYFRGVFQ